MASEGSPQGIHALPEELLINVFAGVELAERHRLLALCCRDWHRLVCSPVLLCSVDACIPDTPAVMPRLRSLGLWLVRRAAPHMERLRLRLSDSSAANWGREEEDWRLDFTTTLVAALAACGAVGRLRCLELELNVSCDLHLGTWMAPLASLQRLTIRLGDGVIFFDSSLRCLTALRHLCCSSFTHTFGGVILWQPGSMLPASLTSLCLGGESGTNELPRQVGDLTSLQQLVLLQQLADEKYGMGGASWEQLRSLTALRMSGWCTCAPSCLDRLTQLRSLHLARLSEDEYISDARAELLCEALPALQQLTHLGLDDVLPSPPSSLASLTQLRSFGFVSYEDPEDPPVQLPAGPWLVGLRRLAGTCNVLAASLPALAAASQLQELGMLQVADRQRQSAVSILRWAAGLPAMSRVYLECWHWSIHVQQAAKGWAWLFPRLTLDAHHAERPDECDWQRICPGLPAVPSRPR